MKKDIDIRIRYTIYGSELGITKQFDSPPPEGGPVLVSLPTLTDDEHQRVRNFVSVWIRPDGEYEYDSLLIRPDHSFEPCFSVEVTDKYSTEVDAPCF